MTPPDLVAVAVEPVVNILERLCVRYLIGGSVASSVLGVPRATIDVDLVCDLQLGHVSAFVSALEADYYIDAEMIRDAIQRRSTFNLIHLATMLKVDVFVLKSRPFDRLAITRHIERPLEMKADARQYCFHSAEDLILNKLEWYRMGGETSDRQWTDILGIIKVQGASLDGDHLRRWAADLSVQDLLERALADAGAQL